MKCFLKCLFCPLALLVQLVFFIVAVLAVLPVLCLNISGCFGEILERYEEWVAEYVFWPTDFYRGL